MVDILEFVVDITLKWLIFHPNLSELVLAMRERKHPHVHVETSVCIGKKILRVHADPPHFHAHEKNIRMANTTQNGDMIYRRYRRT